METILKDISKSYNGRRIFCNASMVIKPNSPIVLMGGNGCGRSTLLKIIAGILSHTDGEIIRPEGIKITYSPDRLPLSPFKVMEYLQHMGSIQGLAEEKIFQMIDAQFRLFGIPANIMEQKIQNCSKGTVQKINIIQAFLTKPDLLIMDEPFSGLDENSIEMLTELILATAKQSAVIISCHEKFLAERIADKLYEFNMADNGAYFFVNESSYSAFMEENF